MRQVQLGDLVISNANTVPLIDPHADSRLSDSTPNGVQFGWVYEISEEGVRVCYQPHGLMFLGDGFARMSGASFVLCDEGNLDSVPVHVEMEFNSLSSRNPMSAVESYVFAKTVNVWSLDNGTVSHGYEKMTMPELVDLASRFSGFSLKLEGDRTIENVVEFAKYRRLRATVNERFLSVNITRLGFHKSFKNIDELNAFEKKHLTSLQMQGLGVKTYAFA